MTKIPIGIISCFLVFTAINSSAAGFDLIIHSKVKIDQLNQKKIRRLLLADNTRWSDGTSVILVKYEAERKEEKEFARELGLRPAQLRRRYLTKLFSGQLSESPIEVDSKAEMIRIVKNTQGALGYIPRNGKPKGVSLISLKGKK